MKNITFLQKDKVKYYHLNWIAVGWISWLGTGLGCGRILFQCESLGKTHMWPVGGLSLDLPVHGHSPDEIQGCQEGYMVQNSQTECVRQC